MMIVMLRDKVQMIHETHGLLQSRMQLGTSKESWLKFPYAIHQTSSRCAELNQNLHQIPAVVFCFMSFAIAKVRGGEHVSIRQKVIHSAGGPSFVSLRRLLVTYLPKADSADQGQVCKLELHPEAFTIGRQAVAIAPPCFLPDQ